jgi:adenine-specific DNA-methyltransferase
VSFLQKPYSRTDFLSFLRDDFLPDFTIDNRPVKTHDKSLLTGVEKLGESALLGITIFEALCDDSDRGKRVAITQDAFRLLRDTATRNAMIVFRTENGKEWRLSLLTSTLELKDGHVVSKFSNPHRFSYLLGPYAKTVTPYNYLVAKEKVINFDDLQKRFSVEVVNNDFYRQIAKLYDKLVGIGGIKADLAYPGNADASHQFAVRLIGRIVFCWFLQEKHSVRDVPLLSRQLLSSDAAKQDNYYHEVLAPLFFEVLNKPIESRVEKFAIDHFSKVPYLNGGLFAPQNDDFYRFDKALSMSVPSGGLSISDSWIRELFELLETYNFTVDENTSVDIDLSIDPEMLGRIFENLLARINPETGETVRKSTGSFYTPREIVEYMVDESLVLYLRDKTGVSEDKVRALVSYDLSDDVESPLDETDRLKIVAALGQVKILDPACGSGAFPIGILQKIVFILQQVDPDTKLWLGEQLSGASIEFKRELAKQSFDYIRKSEVIRKSIFGVDIQPIATEIARLRCFLTLIVDENVDDDAPNRGVKVLPNLDFKFVTVNSLIRAPGGTVDSPKLFDDFEQLLTQTVDDYFSAEGVERAELSHKLRDIIDGKVNENKNYVLNNYGLVRDERFAEVYNQRNEKQNVKLLQDADLWESYKNIFNHQAIGFYETKYIFPSAKDGFDIVIANPPYVSEKGRKEMFRQIASYDFGKKYYKGKMDLFYFFIHAGLDLLKDRGILSFITTNYYLTATNADKLREDYRTRATLLKFINFHELKIFESALGQHNLVTLLEKGKQDVDCNTVITRRKGYLKNTHQILAQILNGVDDDTEYYIKPQDAMFNSRGFIDLRDNPLSNLMENLSLRHPKLGQSFDVSEGLQTGNNTVFVFDELPPFKVKALPEELGYIKPFYKNSDVEQYYTNKEATKHVLYVHKNFVPAKNPNIMAYLSEHEKELVNRAQIKRSKQPWYTLLWPREESMFTGEKIVFPYRAKTNIFSLVDREWFSGTDTYFIYNGRRSLKLCLAILNSRLALCWLKNKGAVKGDVLELKGDVVMGFPLPEKSDKTYKIEEDLIAALDELIIKKKADSSTDVSAIARNMDQLVYKFYELTPDDIKTIELS